MTGGRIVVGEAVGSDGPGFDPVAEDADLLGGQRFARKRHAALLVTGSDSAYKLARRCSAGDDGRPGVAALQGTASKIEPQPALVFLWTGAADAAGSQERPQVAG